jgi:2-keto-4-pentenoate hydratase
VSIDAVVQALVDARRQRRQQAAAPYAGELADDREAYAVQDRVSQALGWGPAGQARHWKSGGPSPSARQTHAPLPPPGVHDSPARLQAGDFHQLGIEAEIAFRVGVDTPPQGVAGAIDAMCVAIELVDTRWVEGPDAPPMLKLADLQAHGALVLGAWQRLRDVDWRDQPCRVHIGAQASEFRGSHSFGDPRDVLPRWAEHVASEAGIVRAGTIVTTGTWCGLLTARAGDEVTVDFPGIGRALLQL